MNKLYWQNYSDVRLQLTAIEKDWLFNKDSLTQRLKALSHNNFSLEILKEGKQYLRADECEILNLKVLLSEPEWVREVVLKGNNISWVYARTVILPTNISKNSQDLLKYIGRQPLGFVLFNNSHFNRSIIEVTKYPQKLLPDTYSYSNLWARRSCFTNNAQKLVVQEVFLPHLWAQL